MKKRVSVYIDEGTWEWVKERAWELRISASALFAKLIAGEIAFMTPSDVKEHIEGKGEVSSANKRLMEMGEDSKVSFNPQPKESQTKKGAK
jgi:hypothetical protein